MQLSGALDLRELEQVILSAGGHLKRDGIPKQILGVLDEAADMMSALLRPTVIPGPQGQAPLDLSPPAAFAHFELVDRWTVNARAVLAAQNPVILLHAATPLFLVDAFYALLAYRHILPDFGGGGERLGPTNRFPLFDYDRQRDWLEFTPAATRIDFFKIDSHYEYSRNLRIRPVSDRRRLIASKLYRKAMMFVFHHEYAHVRLGHLAYAKQQYATDEIVELFSRDGSNQIKIPAEEVRAIELEADREALYQLMQILKPDDNSPYNWEPNVELPVGFDRAAEELLFSVGALLLLFESCDRGRCSEATHPSPRARLLNVLTHAEITCKRVFPEKFVPFSSGAKRAFQSLDSVATLLELPATIGDVADRLSAESKELEAINNVAKRLQARILEARRATEGLYFLDGNPIRELEYYRTVKAPHDPYLLSGQSVTRKADPERDFEEVYRWELPSPDDPAAFVTRGDAYCRDGENEKAVRDYRIALTINPSYEPAARGLALTGLLFGRHDVWCDAVARLVASRSLSANEEEELGEGHLNRKELYSALVCYSLAHVIDPTRTEPLNRRSLIWHLLGRYRETVQDCDAILVTNPERFDVWVNRGNAHADMGKFDQAFADFDNSLRINPNNDYALENKGIAAARSKQYAVALDCFSRLLELDPNDGDTYAQRGSVLTRLRRLPEAINDITRAIEIDPNNSQFHHALAVAYIDANRYSEALGAISQAVTISPSYGVGFSIRATLLLHLGRSAEAADDAREAIRQGYATSDTFLTLIRSCESAQSAEEALTVATRAVSNFPGNTELLVARARLRMTEDKVNALADLNEALHHDRASGEANLLRSVLWVERGEYGRALEDLDCALLADPSLVPHLCLRAHIRLLPNHPGTDFILARLDAINACEVSDWKSPRALETYADVCSDGKQPDMATGLLNAAAELSSGAEKTRLQKKRSKLSPPG